MIDMFPSLDLSDIPEVRRVVAEFSETKPKPQSTPSSGDVVKMQKRVPGYQQRPAVGVRIYIPKKRLSLSPALIHFHGGGFCFGDLDTDDAFCERMCALAGAVCINVDYRLAPENPFPAAFDDGISVSKWLFEQSEDLGIDLKRVVLTGTSAGACVAGSVALFSRDCDALGFALQMLSFPVLDDRCQSQSMQDATDTPVWNRQNSIDMWRHYLGELPKPPPYAVPMRAKNLCGLPPAYIATAEHDPLRDEALEYALRLMKDGVAVDLHNYAGTFHVFDKFESAEISRRFALDRIEAFKRLLSNP